MVGSLNTEPKLIGSVRRGFVSELDHAIQEYVREHFTFAKISHYRKVVHFVEGGGSGVHLHLNSFSMRNSIAIRSSATALPRFSDLLIAYILLTISVFEKRYTFFYVEDV